MLLEKEIDDTLRQEEEVMKRLKAACMKVADEVENTTMEGVRPIKGNLIAATVKLSTIAGTKDNPLSPEYYIPKAQADAIRSCIKRCHSLRDTRNAVRRMLNEGVTGFGKEDVRLNDTTMKILRNSEIASI